MKIDYYIYQDHHSWLTSWCSEPVSTKVVCQLYHCSFYHPSVRQALVLLDIYAMHEMTMCLVIVLFCGMFFRLMILDASSRTWGQCIKSVATKLVLFIWDPSIFTSYKTLKVHMRNPSWIFTANVRNTLYVYSLSIIIDGAHWEYSLSMVVLIWNSSSIFSFSDHWCV